MENNLKILLVEDSEADSDLLIRHLKRENIQFNYLRVWNKEAFEKGLSEFTPDLIIADHTLPQFSGMEAFRLLRKETKSIPFILITGSVSEKLLTEYAKEGIDDYIMKGNLLRLPSSIENVINKKRIEKLHEQLKIAHKDISDSINYAKIIQDAMLPDKSLLKEFFPQSFILFQPKDVLSGDFYWFEKTQETLFIAVADCTGHGIPGALLSMMGFNMLYEAVGNEKVAEPAEVLDKLNKQFSRIRGHNSAGMRDGMDIVFCAVDLNKYTIKYAGAKRPLFIVRAGELLEFKPDKISISAIENKEKKFTPHNIDLKKGDRIFLFSDGYADQFHYKTDKKITSKRLKQLMTKGASLPLKEQEKIMKGYFNEWKGNKEQVDDVLVIGMEIS